MRTPPAAQPGYLDGSLEKAGTTCDEQESHSEEPTEIDGSTATCGINHQEANGSDNTLATGSATLIESAWAVSSPALSNSLGAQGMMLEHRVLR